MIRLANSRSADLRSSAKNHTQKPNTPARGPSPQTWLAFTLIELLVVITIIGVLAALFLPALTRAKASAKSTRCKSNLKQIGLALNLYVTDFGKYPFLRDNSFRWLGDFLAPYLGSNMPVCTLGAEIYDLNDIGTGYLDFNADLGLSGLCRPGSCAPVPESRVLVPSDMIAALHAADFVGFFGFGFPGMPMGTMGTGSFHQGGDNAVFCDGHVESEKSELIPKTAHLGRHGETYWTFKPDEAHARRWNNDNEPHPETWPKP